MQKNAKEEYMRQGSMSVSIHPRCCAVLYLSDVM